MLCICIMYYDGCIETYFKSKLLCFINNRKPCSAGKAITSVMLYVPILHIAVQLVHYALCVMVMMTYSVLNKSKT